MRPTLDQLNRSSCADFVSALGHLFEHSPWVAEETWPRRPFHDIVRLHAELCLTMRSADRVKQLALINAHPDLAGRLAQQKKLTAESMREQSSAGLDQLTEAELAEFTRLNDSYKAKFVFPFIICARLNAKSAIFAAMRARLGSSPDVEFATALSEIEKIAFLRLNDSLSN